jgi:deoxyribodipyrimidine photo-lyase
MIRAPVRAPEAGSIPLPTDFQPPSGLGFGLMPSAASLGLDDESALTAPADPRGVLAFVGGEKVALGRLKHYLWDSDSLGTYFETRNGMLGPDYSSKFAPWMALGNLSPRTIAAECKRYEKERVENKSTYWMVFELIWRDFYRFYAAKHGDRIFKIGGPIRSTQQWRKDPQTLERWKLGKLGVPLVDANMRELAATGFMSNRGRQNVASYLALDLQLDWRTGADHFESLLLDYDVASNWGNWAAAAGVTGGRVNRFNIVKQSKDYDADGAYVRHWCPELENLPNSKVHEPWSLSDAEQKQYGLQLGVDYPRPPKSHFSYGEPRGGKGKGGGGKGGGRGRDTSQRGGAIPSTPRTDEAMRGGGGGKGRGRGGGRGGGRKRVQTTAGGWESDD